VAYAYNSSYSGGRDQEELDSNPTRANSSTRPYRKILHEKPFTGGVAQGEGLEFKPQYHTHTYTHNIYKYIYQKKIQKLIKMKV
jgi:hypothetical protein